MTTIIEHLGITPGLSPWRVQIAMLPVKRLSPDAIRSRDPVLRQRAIEIAARRAEKAQANIVAILRAGPKCGMTADQITAPKPATGNTYRHLEALVEKRVVEKNKIRKNNVVWKLIK